MKTGAPNGAHNGNVKLTADDVRAMRASYKAGQTTQKELAEKYGLSPMHVNRIIRLKYWKHVT